MYVCVRERERERKREREGEIIIKYAAGKRLRNQRKRKKWQYK